MSELEKRLLGMLESLLSITEQFTEGEVQFDDEAMKEWYRISAETADIREGEKKLKQVGVENNSPYCVCNEFQLHHKGERE
jgi:hypothetical protein